MQYFARSPASENDLPQTYLEHVFHVLVRSRCYLRKVLHYARDWNAEVIRRTLELAAEYHDLGKLNNENQCVLSGEKKAKRLPVSHADAGVACLIEDVCSAALLIYAHHAGLPDYSEISLRGLRNTDIQQQIDAELPELLKWHKENVRPAVCEKTPPSATPALKPADIRLLFSCLTHADHGDAASATEEEPRRLFVPKLRAPERLEALRHYVAELGQKGEASERNQMRSAFFDACSTGSCSDAIKFCDAPVGTGKTTSIMAHLLKVASTHGLRRIFVILPFTNIISQSVSTYREALTLVGENGEDVVAEIHHRADFDSIESRKLTALWNAPIIVTTAVAFFETLASASPSVLRRLQNLPGSAVFLDEAHAMLPVKLLPLAWRWIQHAADKWACHWVLASGSLVKFWTLEEFNNSDVELSNILPSEHQADLRKFESERICYRYYAQAMDISDLVNWVKNLDGPVIVVLNTVSTAAAAARAAVEVLGINSVMHLSTALTPADREVTMERIVSRLDNRLDTQWCLFATSCVEAGVDLSFRTGVRECASVLSLLQLAGRVNRNSEYLESDVWTVVLNANDRGVRRNPSFNVSARILRDFFEQKGDISQELCTLAMKREICETGSYSTKLNNDECNYAFRTVNREFRVIEDDAHVTIIDSDLVTRIKTFEDVSWHEIQRGSLRIRRNIREILDIEESVRYPGVFLWPEGAKYSSFLGYMEAVLDLTGFDKNGGAIV